MWKNADISRADIPNRKSYIFPSCLQNTSIMPDQESRQTPQKHISWFNKQVMQITYTALYKHLALPFQWLFTVAYLHDITTYSCTKYMQMLSGLLPINTSSLISFHKQYSVLLHQGTTFKALLSLVLYRKRAKLHEVTLTFTFMHQVGLTFEDADIHSAECSWEDSGHEIWPLEHWVIYVDESVLFLLLLLLLNVVVPVVHLWLWINSYNWTRTTTLHSNNNMSLSKKIAQFIYIDVFVVVVVVVVVVTR